MVRAGRDRVLHGLGERHDLARLADLDLALDLTETVPVHVAAEPSQPTDSAILLCLTASLVERTAALGCAAGAGAGAGVGTAAGGAGATTTAGTIANGAAGACMIA